MAGAGLLLEIFDRLRIDDSHCQLVQRQVGKIGVGENAGEVRLRMFLVIPQQVAPARRPKYFNEF